MSKFPRTKVGKISLSRMIIGTNWFMGYSHTSFAKDKVIHAAMEGGRMAEIITVFLKAGVDAIMGPPHEKLAQACDKAEQKAGKKLVRIWTPSFTVGPGQQHDISPEKAFDQCKKFGAAICMPHQCITDALLDLLNYEIRDIDKYAKMIRERGMVPGLSTHRHETPSVADNTKADVETYIQIYNAAGFLMGLEVDWVMRIIKEAKKPVMTIKPMAAGGLLPPVGLAFVWNTIRERDMVCVGTMHPDEAKECIELSLDFLARRLPSHQLQKTRSKRILDKE